MYRPMRRVYAVFMMRGTILLFVPQFLVVLPIPGR